MKSLFISSILCLFISCSSIDQSRSIATVEWIQEAQEAQAWNEKAVRLVAKYNKRSVIIGGTVLYRFEYDHPKRKLARRISNQYQFEIFERRFLKEINAKQIINHYPESELLELITAVTNERQKEIVNKIIDNFYDIDSYRFKDQYDNSMKRHAKYMSDLALRTTNEHNEEFLLWILNKGKFVPTFKKEITPEYKYTYSEKEGWEIDIVDQYHLSDDLQKKYQTNIEKIIPAITGEKSKLAVMEWYEKFPHFTMRNLEHLSDFDSKDDIENKFLKNFEILEKRQVKINRSLLEMASLILDPPKLPEYLSLDQVELIKKKLDKTSVDFFKIAIENVLKYDGEYLTYLLNKESSFTEEERNVARIVQFIFKKINENEKGIDSRIKIDYLFDSKFKDSTRKILKEAITPNFKNVENIRNEVRAIFKLDFDIIDKTISEFLDGPILDIKDLKLKRMLTLFITGYLERLPEETKFKIMSDIVKVQGKLSLEEGFEIIVQNSGPNFQKYLQMISNRSDASKKFKEIIQKLEKDIKPTRFEVIESIMDLEVSDAVFESKDPLGQGTMASTYSVKIDDKGPFAVRILRPDLENILDKEEEILDELSIIVQNDPELIDSPFQNLKKIITPITRNTRKELNTTRLKSNQEFAREVYSNLSKEVDLIAYTDQTTFNVPKTIKLGKYKQALVQEKIEGEGFRSFFDKYPHLEKQTVEDLAKLWTREAFFSSGFHHADLHLGNILFEKLEGDRAKVHILDYGLATTIDKEVRSNLLRGGLAFNQGSLDEATSFLREALFGEESRPIYEDLLVSIKEANDQNKKSGQELIEFLVQEGFQLRDSIISLQRGSVLLDQQLSRAGSSLTIQRLVEDNGEKIFKLDQKNKFRTISVSDNRSKYRISPFDQSVVSYEVKKKVKNTCHEIARKIINIFPKR